MIYGKYVPYVEKRPKGSTIYFLCEDCYKALNQVDKLLYIESSCLIKPGHASMSSTEKDIFISRMRSVCSVITNALSASKVEFIAVGYALFFECYRFIDLNVLNVNVNLRGQEVGTIILESFRSFANTNNYSIRITISNFKDAVE